ncbi:DNA methyltransferase, partial [Thermoactinomyces vulgaris]|uniref:DNA methyltransferase n=1 Tax=Thermoactinomyces vulgaris TaxID=2026 RepID=UPI003638A78F
MERMIHGDCLEELKKLPSESVDSVVTDPPYGLSKEPNIYEVLTKWMSGEDYHHRGGGFMGKSWDSFVPGPSIWKEVFRVLKPGGHVLCFAGTRTQDLMTISLRLAGFEVRDVVEWLYF